MIIPLQLRHRSTSGPAPEAWFLPGNSVERWLAELARSGLATVETRMFLVPISLANRAPAGLLVVPAKAASPARQPAGTGFRLIAGRLFIPVDAVLHPPVTDAEVRTLCPLPVSIFHPALGLSGFEEASTLRIWNLLAPPAEVQNSWNAAQAGEPPLPELQSITLIQPPSIEDIFGDASDEIGSEPLLDLPPAPEEPKETPLAKAKRNVGMLFAKGVGTALRLVPRTGSRRTWVNGLEDWAARHLNSANEQLDRIRNKELLRLLNLLKTDPETGLRHAIPLNAFAHRGVAQSGGRLGTRSPNFDLNRMGGHAADFWNVPPDMKEMLRQHYREMANREMQLGRHRRAAYIYAELLGDTVSAANTLKQGLHFREAAFLYEEHLKNPGEAARCLAEGGLLPEAIDLYTKLGRWLDVADLHSRLGNHVAAEEAVRRVVRDRMAHNDMVGAAKLLDQRVGATDEAIALLLRGWPHSEQAAECISEALHIYARLGRHDAAFELIGRLPSNPAPRLVLPLLKALGQPARTYPNEKVRHRAADFSRVLIAHQLANEILPPDQTARLMEHLVQLAPEDRLLARDANRHLFGRRESELRVRRATPPPVSGKKPIVVRRIELPRQMEWLQLRSEWNFFYVVGATSQRLTLVRGSWDGEVQSLSWNCPVATARNGLLFEPTREQGQSVILKTLSGPDFSEKYFPAADAFFGKKTVAGTPDWLKPQHWPVAFGDESIWTAHVAGGRGVLSNHDRRGKLQHTIDVTEELLAGAERNEETRLCLAVIRNNAAIALGNRLVLVGNNNELQRIELPGQVTGLHNSPPHTRSGLAIMMQHGASFHWLGTSGLIELDRDLALPHGAFVPGGPLVLISKSQAVLFDVDLQGIQKVTRFEVSDQRPVGICATDSPNHFAVLGAKGELTVYRIPQ
ncbi:MAG TPA: hypothetical protein VK742_09085 [Candidatus Sulfotelmatobacter sp.]|nr:hypothetical protein [Candidatus Sulfotelmatobacter sp.]